jgi:hypothetical protein
VVLELLEPFAEQLRSRRYASLNLATHVFPSENHGSMAGVATSWGLRYLFDRLKVDA